MLDTNAGDTCPLDNAISIPNGNAVKKENPNKAAKNIGAIEPEGIKLQIRKKSILAAFSTNEIFSISI